MTTVGEERSSNEVREQPPAFSACRPREGLGPSESDGRPPEVLNRGLG